MSRPNQVAVWLHFIVLASASASAGAAAVCPVVPATAPPAPGAETSLTADSASFQRGVAMVEGDVRLEYGDQALEAPSLIYERDSGRALAERGLRYIRDGVSMTAERAKIDIDDRTGLFQGAQFALAANGGRGQAAEIEALEDGRYRLLEADYTTCPGDDPAWKLSAENIRLDRDRGRGEAFDTVLRLFGLPVFYSPYLNFPIDDRRHTGFLTPTVGHTGDNGFELAIPFYLNLAPHRDATLTPRLLTRRGLQLAGQFRYLNRHSKGQVEGEFLPSDDVYGDDRSFFHIGHVGRFGRHLGLEIDYNKASDDDYFDDLGSLTNASQSHLERSMRLTLAAPGARLVLLAQDFQVLDQDRALQDEPYGRLPAAWLSLLSPPGEWRAGLDAQAVRFRHDEAPDARRYHLRPRAIWSRDRRGWFLTGQAGYHYTRYDLPDAPAGGIRERRVPGFSLDAGLRLRRALRGGWIQTLEPRVFYLYNAYRDQSDLPLFDTGVPNLHFQRLFAHNRFIGIDRIGDANQVALGLTSRLVDPETGRGVLELNVGRIYGFRDLRVRLPQRSPIGFGKRHSDIVAGVEYRPVERWFTGTTVQYDPDEERLNRGGLRAGYSDENGRRLELGYQFFRDLRPFPTGAGLETLEQTEVLATLPLGARWHAVGRWNYSLDKNQSVETLAGVEYRPSCCWAVRGAWERLVGGDGEYDTAVMLQFEFTGLGRFGDDIESLLQRGIVGGGPD